MCCEAGEQCGAVRSGAGGAKGWDQGECEPAPQGPDAEPGNRVKVLARIRQTARQRKKERFTALFHHINLELLRDAFSGIEPEVAPSVDGLTWQDYAENLECNLQDLHARVQSGAYRALPSRRQYMPKPDGRQRPLAVAALEDKIVQRATATLLLNAIYEEDFLGFSYGSIGKQQGPTPRLASAFYLCRPHSGNARHRWVYTQPILVM
jgi:hypothetical protein